MLALPLFVALPLSIWVQERIIARCLREELVNQCTACGYDLTGNVSGVCPECGTIIPPNRSNRADDLR